MTEGGRPPRVLVLVERFPSVSETFVVDHVLGLLASGFEVDVGCFLLDRDALADLTRREGVALRVHEAPRSGGRPSVRQRGVAYAGLLLRAPAVVSSVLARSCALGAAAIRELVDRARPDVVHAHFGPTGVTARLALGRRDVPLIVEFHGYDVTSFVARHGWRPYRAVLSDAIAIVHSAFVEDLVRRHLDLDRRRVTLGVDLGRFAEVARGAAWQAPVRLLTCGRLVFQKGHHVALDALALLRRRAPERDFQLTIVGEGPERAALEERARLLGLADAVRFTGALDPLGVAEEMGRADVLLVPSLRPLDGAQEAFCRVAVEGMARSLLVIGTTTGGLAETIGTGGVVTSPADPLALAEALSRALQERSPAEWGRAARARASEFSAERSRREYAAVTHEALAARRTVAGRRWSP